MTRAAALSVAVLLGIATAHASGAPGHAIDAAALR